MSSPAIRVRFAPSPTGSLHIGNVRAALFNWLFARHHDGTFLIRIEDTDKVRSTQEFLQAQLDAFEWLGLKPDEEPVIQSSRNQRHQEVMAQLLKADVLYEKEGAIWFRVPRDVPSLSFIDLIRGGITVPIETIDDFVVRRSDGSPIYNFCVVVDDHDMEISHVIRGEDHISNTFKQLMLYAALGWDTPQFAHLPLIVNDAGTPLSKRDGITDVARYRQNGFLADALLNYLVRLGWSHGDKEIFSRAEMIQLFTLGGVGKKAAVFDTDKLSWINQQHMMTYSAEQLHTQMRQLGCGQHGQDNVFDLPAEQAYAYLELYKSRATTLVELADMISQLAVQPVYDSLPVDAAWLTPNTGRLMYHFIQAAQAAAVWDKQTLLGLGREVVKAAGVGLALLGQPLRYAITGTISSPGIFDIMAIMGRDECLARLQQFEHTLRS